MYGEPDGSAMSVNLLKQKHLEKNSLRFSFYITFTEGFTHSTVEIHIIRNKKEHSRPFEKVCSELVQLLS